MTKTCSDLDKNCIGCVYDKPENVSAYDTCYRSDEGCYTDQKRLNREKKNELLLRLGRLVYDYETTIHLKYQNGTYGLKDLSKAKIDHSVNVGELISEIQALEEK